MRRMTRLSQIIDGAASDAVPVATLLRQVKVVATRLGTVELEDWVNRELSGYDRVADLPVYRGPFTADVIGQFAGPFGSNPVRPIPQMSLPEDLRGGDAFQIAFTEPITSLEELAKAKSTEDGGNFQVPWNADMVLYINYLLQRGYIQLVEGHGLLHAYRRVSPQQLGAVVDAVRTRVLNLALDLEKVAPSAGDLGDDTALNPEQERVIVNNIYGDGNNVSVNSPGSVQATHVVKKGDLAALRAAVAATGIPPETAAEVIDAVVADEAEAHARGEDPAPGERTQGVLGRLTLGVGSTGGKVATAAAGGVVSGLVRAYFGF